MPLEMVIDGDQLLLWCIKGCHRVVAERMWLCQHQSPAGGSLARPRGGDDCSSLVQQQLSAFRAVNTTVIQQNTLHLQRHVVTPAVGATL
jgi:hypothetical protein